MWVSIEGNIGVGKTTFGNKLSNALKKDFIAESIDTDPDFRKHLSKFNENPKYSLELQKWMTAHRQELALGLDRSKEYLVERSVFGDYTFSFTNYLLGNMNEEEFDVYRQDFFLQSVEKGALPDLVIILNTSPEKCYDRVHNLRKRKEESNVSLDYLYLLDSLHKNFMPEVANELGIECISFDSEDFFTEDPIFSEIVKTLRAKGY